MKRSYHVVETGTDLAIESFDNPSDAVAAARKYRSDRAENPNAHYTVRHMGLCLWDSEVAMGAVVSDLESAARRLLAAQGGSWERGNVYISRHLADELNAAMKQLVEVLTRTQLTADSGSK